MARVLTNASFTVGIHYGTTSASSVWTAITVGGVKLYCLPGLSNDPGSLMQPTGVPLDDDNPGYAGYFKPGDRIRSAQIGEVIDTKLNGTNTSLSHPPIAVNVSIWSSKVSIDAVDFQAQALLGKASALVSRLPFGGGFTIPLDVEIPEWTRFLYVCAAYAPIAGNVTGLPDHAPMRSLAYVPLHTCQVVLNMDKSS